MNDFMRNGFPGLSWNSTRELQLTDEESKKLIDADLETKKVQAQLEGIFRQLFQSAQQMSMFHNFAYCHMLMQKATDLFNELNGFQRDVEDMIKLRLQEDKDSNKQFQ